MCSSSEITPIAWPLLTTIPMKYISTASSSGVQEDEIYWGGGQNTDIGHRPGRVIYICTHDAIHAFM